MGNADNEIGKFQLSVEPQRGLYRIGVLRIVAFKVGDQLVNLHTQARLGYDEEDLFYDDVTKYASIAHAGLGPLVFYKNSIAVDAFLSMPSEVKGGTYQFATDNGSVSIVYGSAEESGRTVHARQNYQFESVPPERAEAVYGVHLNLSRLHSLSGQPIPQLLNEWDQLEIKLKEQKEPFRGIEHIVQTFLKTKRRITRDTYSTLEFLALPAISLGNRTHVDETTLTLHLLRHPSTEMPEISFGLIELMSDGDEVRQTIAMRDCTLVEGDSSSEECIFSVQIKNVLQVQIFAKYRGLLVDERIVRPAQPILPIARIHEFVDKDLETLRSLLSDSTRRKSDYLEIGVAWLLGITGFVVLPWGLAKELQNAPDGLAMIPDTAAGLVYECMTDQPNSENKLAKLKARLLAYQARFPETKLSAALFTNTTRNRIPRSLIQNAAVDEIALVCHDDILSIIEDIGESLGPALTLRAIQERIPKIPSP